MSHHDVDDLTPDAWTEPKDWLDYASAGDVLKGTVTDRLSFDTVHGELVVIVVETADGEQRVPLGRSGLKAIATKVEVGDKIGIAFHGKTEKGYYRYTHKIQKGDGAPAPVESPLNAWA